MTHQAVRISVLAGATADLAVADQVAQRASLLSVVDVDVIDLETARLPDRQTAMLPAETTQPPVVHDLVPWLIDADGFVVVLSDRSEGVPRQVHNALDWCTTAWAGKPVALVADAHTDRAAPTPPHVRTAFHMRQATVIGPIGVCGDQNSDIDRLLTELVTACRARRRARDMESQPR